MLAFFVENLLEGVKQGQETEHKKWERKGRLKV